VEDLFAIDNSGAVAQTLHKIGLVEGTLESTVRSYVGWQTRLHVRTRQEDVRLGIEASILQRLRPTATPYTRVLFHQISRAWILVADNSKGPSDSESVIPVLTRDLKARGVILHRYPGKRKECAFAALSVSFYDADRSPWHLPSRSIGIVWDRRRWEFIDDGKVYSFEDSDRYRKDPVYTRLDEAYLLDLIAGYGCDLRPSVQPSCIGVVIEKA
jgi:hypothetical protein